LLYGVSPADPVALSVVAAVFVTVALVASAVPARRAASIDPVVVLREG
jgi:ABC-type lipoprotein release transport system permease subunit